MMTPAEAFEVRERKQSLFQLSDDPFDVIAGRHRQSVSGVASSASAEATRRRSSAVAPDAAAAAASHSRYHGEKLAPIESRSELPPSSNNAELATNGARSELPTSSYKSNTVPVNYEDPDAVAPDERR
jgi:hypothetical protein